MLRWRAPPRWPAVGCDTAGNEDAVGATVTTGADVGAIDGAAAAGGLAGAVAAAAADVAGAPEDVSPLWRVSVLDLRADPPDKVLAAGSVDADTPPGAAAPTLAPEPPPPRERPA